MIRQQSKSWNTSTTQLESSTRSHASRPAHNVDVQNAKTKESSQRCAWIRALAIPTAAILAFASAANAQSGDSIATAAFDEAIQLLEAGATILVPQDVPAIQDAIDVASNGDQIIVSAGTYSELINFNGKAICLRSADGPETTIIDGQGMGTVVVFDSGEGANTVIDGFTITNGIAGVEGGGMFISAASPVIRGCHILGNSAPSGGGVAVRSGSAPFFVECEFRENVATERGGGLHCHGSNPILIDCSFEQNEAAVSGGGMRDSAGSASELNSVIFANNSVTDLAGHGGGLDIDASFTEIKGCHFAGNAADFGGGLALHNSDPRIRLSVFEENTANSGGAISSGSNGVTPSTPQIELCTFRKNTASFTGGAIRNSDNSYLTLVDTSFVLNSAVTGGAILNRANGAVALTRAVLIANTASESGGAVMSDSPSVTQAEDTYLCNNAPNNFAGAWMDMGANQICALGDLNGDGLVNGADLAALLAAWMP